MITVVLGRKGCGKSTYIKSRLPALPRVLIFDTLGEFHTHATPYYDLDSFLKALDEQQEGGFRIAYVGLASNDSGSVDIFLRAAWSVGDCTVVLDEIDAIASPTSVPFPLARILRYGRHRGISVIAASRRAAEVPRLLTSQADEVVSFNQSEPNDVEYLKKYVSSEFASEVQRLPRFEYRVFSPWGDDESSKQELDKAEQLE